MLHSLKKDKTAVITLIGMAVMVIAVAVKAATSSVIAAAAIHIAGLACFFLIESIEIFPTKRAYGYLKTIHFSFPVLSGDEIKQTMSIWDTHPDILDEEGNFNGYNPEDDLPPVEMETGTIVVHDEGEVFPPKRITGETCVLLTKRS